MGKKAKYYVVWRGVKPGIYASWEECQQQTEGFPAAAYKAFPSREEAEWAFGSLPEEYISSPTHQNTATSSLTPTAIAAPTPYASDGARSQKSENASQKSENASQKFEKAPQKIEKAPPYYNRGEGQSILSLPPEVNADAIAVDAACSGNPGPMEYRGVDLRTGQTLFHFGPLRGTNNIGEFLAIVHALAYLKQQGRQCTVYSDSRNALMWIKARRCKTNLPRTAKTEQTWQLILRAEQWLATHTFNDIPVLKWQTDKWGEVPADFGRK